MSLVEVVHGLTEWGKAMNALEVTSKAMSALEVTRTDVRTGVYYFEVPRLLKRCGARMEGLCVI